MSLRGWSDIKRSVLMVPSKLCTLPELEVLECVLITELVELNGRSKGKVPAPCFSLVHVLSHERGWKDLTKASGSFFNGSFTAERSICTRNPASLEQFWWTVLVSIIIMTERPVTEFSSFLWLNTLLKFLKPFRNDFSPTLGDKSLSGFEFWQAGYIGIRVNSISFFAVLSWNLQYQIELVINISQ